MSEFSYRLVKGKYVITKGDGAYFTIKPEQALKLISLACDIYNKENLDNHVTLYEQKDNRTDK